jgi:hypothetical protein
MAERTLSTNRFGVGSVVSRLRLLFIGTLTGIMGGMGAFLFINSEFMPLGLGENWGLLIIGVAGVYTHVISADLTESIGVAIIAYTVGLGVHVGTSIAPLWILSYPPLARDLLLPSMVGQAIAGNFFGYLTMFFGSYCAAVVVDGYYER